MERSLVLVDDKLKAIPLLMLQSGTLVAPSTHPMVPPAAGVLNPSLCLSLAASPNPEKVHVPELKLLFFPELLGFQCFRHHMR